MFCFILHVLFLKNFLERRSSDSFHISPSFGSHCKMRVGLGWRFGVVGGGARGDGEVGHVGGQRVGQARSSVQRCGVGRARAPGEITGCLT